MAELTVTMVGMLSEDMPPAMLRVDTLVSVLAAHVPSILHEPRAVTRVLQVAKVIGAAAATGEAVLGESVIGIRHTDILDLAITARAMAIHTSRVAITVTATVGTIRTTDIIRGDITLTATDPGPT